MRISFFSILVLVFSFSSGCLNSSAEGNKMNNVQEEYQCLPCGADCDKTIHKQAGTCSQCNMELVIKSTVRFHTIQPEAICQYIKDHPEIVLIDVRTKEEYEGRSSNSYGTLIHAINIPVQELNARLIELEKYKGKEILVYCSHSHRSPRAAYILGQNGFENVTNMAGGMSVMRDKTCMK